MDLSLITNTAREKEGGRGMTRSRRGIIGLVQYLFVSRDRPIAVWSLAHCDLVGYSTVYEVRSRPGRVLGFPDRRS